MNIMWMRQESPSNPSMYVVFNIKCCLEMAFTWQHSLAHQAYHYNAKT